MDPAFNLIADSSRPRDPNRLNNVFEQQVSKANRVEIAVGYVDVRSLAYLREVVEEQYPQLELDLTIGIQSKEGMSRAQLDVARPLHDYLTREGRGGVYATPRLPFHGKVFLFDHASGISAYVGSANLSSIVPDYKNTREVGVFFDSAPQNLEQHLRKEVYPLREPIDEANIPVVAEELFMEELDAAEPVTVRELSTVLSSTPGPTFHIPLKTQAKSSLNAHRASGGYRVNSKTGSKKRRSWYEGEIIVPSEIYRLPDFPQGGHDFRVLTDDGWSFVCGMTGTPAKNLRSKVGGLEPFGAWIKSRLVSAGALKYGETATEETLRKFGRKYMTITNYPEQNVWYFDLHVDENTPLEIPDNE